MRLSATIDADGSWSVLVDYGARHCHSHPPSPLLKGNVRTLVEHSVTAAIGTTQDAPHWYVSAFAVNAMVTWIENEIARNTHIDVNVKRSFTLEIG